MMITNRFRSQNHNSRRLPHPSTPTSPLDFTHEIPFSELEPLHGLLGRGSYGTVFKGRWRGRTVAVKEFREREEIKSFLVEVEQLSCVKHPNIVTLYGASTYKNTSYLIMEYAEGGSLNHLLHECTRQQYDLRHACSWAMQTAKGVAYLHELRPKPIMHRDLKPANLLLFSRGKKLKICDFGTACAVKTQMTNNTGSASYMAPEVFETTNYTESADVYSWSIIFWEILARRHPYIQSTQPYFILWSVCAHNLRPPELESCPEIIWNLITTCWTKLPEERPTMQQVADRMELIFSLTDNSHVRHLHPQNQKNHHNSSLKAHQVAGIERKEITDMKSPQDQQFCRLLPTISPQFDNNSGNHALHNRNSHQNQQTTSSLFKEELSSPFKPLHQARYQQQISSLRSFNGPDNIELDTMSENGSKKELFVLTRALQHRLDLLRRRAEDLQGTIDPGCDKRDTSFALKEFEDLKKQTELRKQELRIRYDSNQGISSPLAKSPPFKVPLQMTCASPENKIGRI